ncbi:MAG TPA: branched-chain amino acid ABC transporter permease [Ottowia sp.]|uniref:branched-chain amino acid ABC transporter permease n=1 Tax=Ottowia sp. TaxID=1898956 RepID=UPI002C927A2B|nr:branched-chain amino acid ABC transporter permease [Ottowia sp.]HMN22030.1 branched-chain amino acid ABC transporter permease [Ottowia sp.]
MNEPSQDPAACAALVPPAVRRSAWPALVVGMLALVALLLPLYGSLAGHSYAVVLASRILVFALAAVGLNLALGYGGMVSFGHAMYIGLGAYVVLICGSIGWVNGWLQLGVLLVTVVLIAAVVGWISLRTHGLAFIMITLALAQLFYFLFVSLRAYGGDDGMSLAAPSGFGPLTGSPTALYYALLAALALAVYGTLRLVQSRFGLVLRAARVNERRVRAVGTGPLGYQLVAYVLSALVCALAGFFLANLAGFVSPAYMNWMVSGELIVMVVLGGVGTVFGPVVGAVALLLLEEVLKLWTEHWPIVFGPLVLLIVVALRRGLWGLLPGGREE